LDNHENQPRVIGLKQSVRAILEGQAQLAILADDADEHIRKEVLDCCRKKNVPVETTESKASLGKACGIERSAAVVAVLKPQQ
jgi:large subunit ribosomal protein L7A